MSKSINILCVHGVGHGEADPQMVPSWTAAINQAVSRWNSDVQVTLDFLHYDAYFQDAEHNVLTYAEAVGRLLASGVINGIGDFFSRSRGLFDIPQQLRWTAGMVAQWAAEEDLRQKTRQALLDQLNTKPYDLVCAHSLGSLISYDTFKRNPKAIKDKVFVSFGSQIGNPFVRDVFAGRIEPLKAKAWYHFSTMRSDAPFMTWLWPVKPGATAMKPPRRTQRRTRSRSPAQAWRNWPRMLMATRRAQAWACSSVTSAPTRPVKAGLPSTSGAWTDQTKFPVFT